MTEAIKVGDLIDYLTDNIDPKAEFDPSMVDDANTYFGEEA